MKKYIIKNYKGNLVESLLKFAKSHKGMRIVEAVEDENELKVKAEVEDGCEKKKINEASDWRNYVDSNSRRINREKLPEYSEKYFQRIAKHLTNAFKKDFAKRGNSEISDFKKFAKDWVDFLVNLEDSMSKYHFKDDGFSADCYMLDLLGPAIGKHWTGSWHYDFEENEDYDDDKKSK